MVKLRSWELKTLKELKENTRAYDGFTTIANSAMPDYYKGIFPKKCDCGAEMIISRDYTKLQCCNPCCFRKQAFRLSNFVSDLGFLGFGDATALRLVMDTKSRWSMNSYLCTFLLDESDILNSIGDAASQNFFNIRDELRNSERGFVEVTSALGMTGVGPSSSLFNYFKTPSVLLNAMLNGTTDRLCEMCRIGNPIVRFGLKTGTLDMFILATKIVGGIRPIPSDEIYVAITGSLVVGGRPVTRGAFIEMCEKLVDTKGVPLFKLRETKAVSKLQYVIADGPSSSEKYKLGEKLGILITGDKFYDMLRSRSVNGDGGNGSVDGSVNHKDGSDDDDDDDGDSDDSDNDSNDRGGC